MRKISFTLEFEVILKTFCFSVILFPTPSQVFWGKNKNTDFSVVVDLSHAIHTHMLFPLDKMPFFLRYKLGKISMTHIPVRVLRKNRTNRVHIYMYIYISIKRDWSVLRNWITWPCDCGEWHVWKQQSRPATWTFRWELMLQFWAWNPQDRPAGWKLRYDFYAVLLRQNFFFGKPPPLCVRPWTH